MNRLDDGFKTVNELAISVSIVLELVRALFEHLKDIIGRMKVSESSSKRMAGWIDLSLFDIVVESGIEDVLKRLRRHFGIVC